MFEGAGLSMTGRSLNIFVHWGYIRVFAQEDEGIREEEMSDPELHARGCEGKNCGSFLHSTLTPLYQRYQISRKNLSKILAVQGMWMVEISLLFQSLIFCNKYHYNYSHERGFD